MSSSGFLIASLGFSMYSIMSSANSVSSLTAVARIAKTMLNINGENGNTCLVPDLRENAFSFLPLSSII